MVSQDALKRRAANAALDSIRPGMVVGLGEGSTTLIFVRLLGRRISAGDLRDVVGIPASERMADEAVRAGIPLTDFERHPRIDLTVDGADEVDPDLNLIKGGGGALLREKILAQASRSETILVDESKLAPALGTRWALPVEVTCFGWHSQARFIGELGAEVLVRRSASGEPYLTDQGNMILDCRFGPIPDPAALDRTLQARAGIVEHGLFVGLADEVIVAAEGGITRLRRSARNPN